MAPNEDALSKLSELGVAVWLDDLSRHRLSSGNLKGLIEQRSVVGVTTNPTIFQTAITKSDDYDQLLKDLREKGASVDDAVRELTTNDVRDACDLFAETAKKSDRRDGRVSLEVDPRLAHDTEKTVSQARELYDVVGRDNLFIKIPATLEGLPSIEASIADGISVNVTLIFSIDRYKKVMDAWLSGLEKRVASGGSLDGLDSVASFFVSRVDTEIDKRLEAIGTDQALALRGRAAVANARLAYGAFLEMLASDRWKALEAKGARPQRPLWASTGVKNPDYSDTLYVIDLAAPGTVNTMPEATLEAVFDHGVYAGDQITGRIEDAQTTWDAVAAVGVDLDDVVEFLERDGVKKFEASWEELLSAVSLALESDS